MIAAIRSPRRRIALLAMALLLVAALLVAGARAAVSASPLPEIGPDELLGSVSEALANPPPISGEIATTLELGLPDLAGLEGDGEGLAALAGDQRVRLWRSEDGLRVARLDDTAEQAFITNGQDVWLWDSTEVTVQHAALPDDALEKGRGGGFDPTAVDPVELAGQALAAVDETTEVSVERAGRVAGRDTYRLLLEPRTEETLIGRIELDVDGEQRIPLRAAIYARDAAAPSLEVAYTSVSFEPIDPATYDFTPPPDATVSELSGEHEPNLGGSALGASRPDLRTFGAGWATVVAIPDVGTDQSELAALLPFSGPLFSARSAEADGRSWILFGPVDQNALDRAAADLP